MGKSFKIDHPDGTFVTPSGKTVTVRGGVATVEEAPAPAIQAQTEPTPNQDNSPGGHWGGVKGAAQDAHMFANTAMGGVPTYLAAGAQALGENLREKFGGAPAHPYGQLLDEARQRNATMAPDSPRARAAGYIANGLVTRNPVLAGLSAASTGYSTGSTPAQAAVEGLTTAGLSGVLTVAPPVARYLTERFGKYAPAILRGIRESKNGVVQGALKGIEEVKQADAATNLPRMPRRPPSMRTPEASPPDEFVGPPPVDPRMRARVENLPGNAVDTVVDAAPAIPPEVPVMPEAPPRMQPNPRPNIDPRVRAKGEALPRNAPKTEVTPLPSTDYAPFENPALGPLRKPPAPKTAVDAPPPEPPKPTTAPSLRAQGKPPSAPTPVEFQMHPEDAAKIDVPDDGLMAKLQEMVRRTSPVGTGKPSWPGAETDSMRAVVPEAPVAPVARGPVRAEFQAPKSDWLDELRASLKSQWGEGKDVAKAMEDPVVRMRARGEKP